MFNKPSYSAIPYLEVLYRPLYPYMVYCGPGYPNVEETPQLKPFQYNFVSYGATPKSHPRQGALTYECVNLTTSLHLPADGYMVIQDDILLAPRELERLSPSLTWFFTPSKFHPIFNWYGIIDFKNVTACKGSNCNVPITRGTVVTWRHYQHNVSRHSDTHLACIYMNN